MKIEVQHGKKYRNRRIGVGLALSTASLLGVAASQVEGNIAHNAQVTAAVAAEPGCADIVPNPGDGVDETVDRVNDAGGQVGGRVDIVRSDGVVRDSANTPSFYNDKANVQLSDTLTVEHANPTACLAVGGHVVQHVIQVDSKP